MDKLPINQALDLAYDQEFLDDVKSFLGKSTKRDSISVLYSEKGVNFSDIGDHLIVDLDPNKKPDQYSPFPPVYVSLSFTARYDKHVSFSIYVDGKLALDRFENIPHFSREKVKEKVRKALDPIVEKYGVELELQY
jgi:hypothetical protein